MAAFKEYTQIRGLLWLFEATLLATAKYIFDFAFSYSMALIVLALQLTLLVATHLKPKQNNSWYLAGNLLLDVVLLTLLLLATGASSNPFTSIYLVYVALSLVLLRWQKSIMLAAFIVLCSSSLFLMENFLPSSAAISHAEAMALHLYGMWVSLGVTTLLVALFVGRLKQRLMLQERIMERQKIENIQDKALAVLGTTAAQTAHELATPLCTATLEAEELSQQLPHHEIPKNILAQLSDCNRILKNLSYSLASPRADQFEVVSSYLFIKDMLTELGLTKVFRVEMTMPEADSHILVIPYYFGQAVKAILKNAIEAQTIAKPAVIRISLAHSTCSIDVINQGEALSPELVANIGTPFYSTKRRGHGLGIFLARTAMRHMNGELEIQSYEGTTIVSMKLQAFASREVSAL